MTPFNDPWFWCCIALVCGACWGWYVRGAHEEALKRKQDK